LVEHGATVNANCHDALRYSLRYDHHAVAKYLISAYREDQIDAELIKLKLEMLK
jgi:hypothetical protein